MQRANSGRRGWAIALWKANLARSLTEKLVDSIPNPKDSVPKFHNGPKIKHIQPDISKSSTRGQARAAFRRLPFHVQLELKRRATNENAKA